MASNYYQLPTGHHRYPGLDGLRGLAVIAVIAYHLNPGWLPGGFLGVDIFFVISGFLITSLLMSEWEKTGALLLRKFWARRARRLLPALVVLLGAVAVLAAIFAPDGVPQLRGDLPASLLFVLNWLFVFHHDSYITASARPPLLLHLWSLAVEEQFYLLWPPVLLVLLRRRIPAARVAAIAATGAVISSLVMALTFQAHHDPSFDYFGTGSHCQGLLIGCALGAVTRPGRMTAAVVPRAQWVLALIGSAALTIAAVGMFVLSFGSPLTYRGGLVLVDLATAAVILIAVHPACRLGRTLDCRPLRWTGSRSYALYLWHWPIFDMTRPGVDLPITGWPVLALRLAATAVAAEGSYRLVEQPWRTGRAQAALRAKWRTKRTWWTWWRWVVVAAAPVVGVAVLVATVSSPSAPPVLAEGATPAALLAPSSNPTSDPAPWLARSIPPPSTHPTTTVSSSRTTTVSATGSGLAAHEPILAIGDSVLLAASADLNQGFGPAITVDAAVGRQPQAGLDRLASYQASGRLSTYRTVVIDLGTNGYFSPQQMSTLTRLTVSVPLVVLYTVRAPRSWIGESNSSIRQEVAGHPHNMRIAHWDTTAGPSLLYPDGIHPNPNGATAYTELLRSVLSQDPGLPAR